MLRLLADENIHGDVIRGLLRRQPSLDIQRVQHVGLRTASDPVTLKWAAAENRIVLTKDRSTMIGFAWDRVRAGLPMPGVLVLPEGAGIGPIIDAILLANACSSQDEWRDQVQFLPT